jgi:hypothetical protein
VCDEKLTTRSRLDFPPLLQEALEINEEKDHEQEYEREDNQSKN